MARKKSNVTIEPEDPEIYNRSKSELVFIPCDTLELRLRDFKNSIHNKSNWINSTAIIITITIALCTANFRNSFGLQGMHWEGIFFFALFLMIIKLLYDLYKLRKKSITVESIINEFKKKQ